AQPEDRRSFVIALTPKGRKAFERMATVHESWVIELLGGMPDQSKQQLYELLGQMRGVLAARGTTTETDPVAKKAAKKVSKK
nr:winged helix-turn-helix transcriptional regulator [Xylophilus sp.]